MLAYVGEPLINFNFIHFNFWAPVRVPMAVFLQRFGGPRGAENQMFLKLKSFWEFLFPGQGIVPVVPEGVLPFIGSAAPREATGVSDYVASTGV